MSEKNVERYRRLLRALSESDDDALVALSDPQIEVHSVFAAVGGAVYQGHDGVRRWQQDLEESWSGEFRVESQAFFDLGDQTLVSALIHGVGGLSGAHVAMPAFGVATWRDGLCISHKAYPNKQDALRDLGVSEGRARAARARLTVNVCV